MEQDKAVNPDAIILFSGGIVPDANRKIGWRSTTYAESDAFGTLGGRDRIEAAALLAKKYPKAMLVTTSHRLGRVRPSLAEIYAQELLELGIEKERIIEEEESATTQTAVNAALALANERKWRQLVFISSGFHMPRIEAFYKAVHSTIPVAFFASETVLSEHDAQFMSNFKSIRESPSYQMRLASEARGIQAIKEGKYKPASSKDKKERGP